MLVYQRVVSWNPASPTSPKTYPLDPCTRLKPQNPPPAAVFSLSSCDLSGRSRKIVLFFPWQEKSTVSFQFCEFARKHVVKFQVISYTYIYNYMLNSIIDLDLLNKDWKRTGFDCGQITTISRSTPGEKAYWAATFSGWMKWLDHGLWK